MCGQRNTGHNDEDRVVKGRNEISVFGGGLKMERLFLFSCLDRFNIILLEGCFLLFVVLFVSLGWGKEPLGKIDIGSWNAVVEEPISSSGDSTEEVSETVQETFLGDSQTFSGPSSTRYALGLTNLPNEKGQFWVVYDISPYSLRFPTLENPQNSIVDWILFDSGDDFWRKEPFSVLSSSKDRLYVYHTTQVQKYVSNVVDRFLDSEKGKSSFSMKVVVVKSPEWRTKVTPALQPITPKIVGTGADVQCWEGSSEELKTIVNDLAKRSDFIFLNESNDIVPNAGTFGWAAASPRKFFNRDYRVNPQSNTGYSADVSSVDEGFRIEATPLLSLTGETLEVTFRYRATAVERIKSFSLRVPTTTSPRQQLNVEKPSIVSCDIKGKVSVPRAKGAIIDLGLVPIILPKREEESQGVLESVSGLITTKAVFHDVLIFIMDKDAAQ